MRSSFRVGNCLTTFGKVWCMHMAPRQSCSFKETSEFKCLGKGKNAFI